MGLTDGSSPTLDLETIGSNALIDNILESSGKRYLDLPNVGRIEVVSNPDARGFGLGDVLSLDLQTIQPIAETLGWSVVANGLYDLIKDGVRRVRVGHQSFGVSADGVANAIEQANAG